MNKQIVATTPKGSSTRDCIVAAARKRLIDHGIDNFALREIADSLEIKLSNLQYYFKTRESLVFQVLEEEAARDRATIKTHQQKSTDGADAFREIVQDLTTRWRGDSGVLFSTLSTLAIHNKGYRKLYRSIYADFYQALEGPIKSLNANLSDSELALRVRLITALIDGAPMQLQNNKKQVFLQRIQEQAESIARAQVGFGSRVCENSAQRVEYNFLAEGRSMSGFIEGENRYQSTMFPERIDDYVDEDSSARVIDVFVDRLDISGLGFKAEPAETGRPGYNPRVMLKIFIYGYMNKVHSSRRLEIEAKRNVELMWLTGRLAPDFKTIADFRKDNGEAIRLVCREFVVLCRKLNLFSKAFVAIDGAKFKAVNTRDKNFTKAKLKRRLQQIDESIERYLSQIESADRQDTDVSTDKKQRLTDKIAALEEEMDRLKKLEVRLLAEPDQQLSLTDPDARSMATSGRGSGMVGYNVQAAVDAEHHLIVAHDVTQDGHDRYQLHRMSTKAKEAMDADHLDVVADRGYFKGEEILACEQDNITTYLPRPLTSGSRKKGLFTKRDFIYHAEDDEYECPAGERLIWRFNTEEKGQSIDKYWSSNCPSCSKRTQCTTSKYRRVARWEHEHVVDELEARLEREPDRMRTRRCTAEHPFGTLKCWMGYTHFLTKTVPKVSTEMSLHVLAYNMKRVMNILGPQQLIEAMQD